MNLRKDAYFVQDENWYRQAEKYDNFIENEKNKNLVLLELGVGFNTPGIIRIPFEQMVFQNKNWNLIRINKNNSFNYLDIEENSILIEEANVQKVNGRNANNGKGIYVGVIEGDDHYEYQVIRIM